MKSREAGAGVRNPRRLSVLISALWLIPCLVISTVTLADVLPGDQQCLTCHSIKGLTKLTGDGGQLPLHIDAEQWADSVHSRMGCAICHNQAKAETHPSMSSIASAREYTVAQSGVCRTCHTNKYQQYEGSIHASLVAAGNSEAPVCASCHDVHGQQHVASYDPFSGEPCKSCHEQIFDAYAGSMHGQARLGESRMQAPICTDCHQAHDVAEVTAGEAIKNACLGCHENAFSAHDEWLPNSGLHLDVVSCPACHSPMAERSVDLRLYDRESKELVSDTNANRQFSDSVRDIDTAGDGLDAKELSQVVRDANTGKPGRQIRLKGRLEVESGVQAHQLALKAQAIRDCSTCHQSGADTYSKVTVSVTGEDGRRVRYETGSESLTSPRSLESVEGFYTVGGTRIKILDYLVVLAILAGIAIPLTHFTVRKIFRNRH
jgi:hypothetical protein